MFARHVTCRLISCLLTVGWLGVGTSPCMAWHSAAETTASPGIYHADPTHLWNRLHEALFVRVGPDGQTYGRDRLEPLLWLGSKHLLEEPSHSLATGLCAEFLAGQGEQLIRDPLKRAILQRDLWLVFNWLQADHSHFHDPQPNEEAIRAARDRLCDPLATMIGRLALSPREIQQLPDNYALTAASRMFPTQFNTDCPEEPFLPADLFDKDGPWVCVGRPDGPMAPLHQSDTSVNVFTNSAFLVFVRLPAGREATIDFLTQLRSFDQPPRVAADTTHGRLAFLPHPNLPRVPVGTQMALVRRALLISDALAPTASPLTESVQLRVYRQVPDLNSQNVMAAIDDTSGSREAAEHSAPRQWQTFHELHLTRRGLFANPASGLRAVGPEDRDFNTPFFLTMEDPFENPALGGTATKQKASRTGFSNSLHLVKQDCFLCHSLPGLASFNSFFNFRANGSLTNRENSVVPFRLVPMSVGDVDQMSVEWKAQRPIWTALRARIK